ncbi:glycosyltransferase [Vulcanisaeta moutnovskia]|nr:glycosyltransferase [Vulcanisaeta moutnovskia]
MHDKGAHLIPEIARRLSGITIHVMGDGYLRDYIISASRKYGNIVYHGFVSNEEKVKIVSNSFLVIMPINWVELYSYTVVESFAMGKPVVSFGVGGPKELIEDSGAGLLARPFDVDDFISKVRYLLGNEDLVRDGC